MSTAQQTGQVIRSLPDRRVVVQVGAQQITARASGLVPRPGTQALVSNPGQGWVVLSWQ
ncbi:hypothetical protein [Deinococcus gobiensis]|uniref:Uncharacterized protein n=1 Tax=Deinococcus gobiensis (strain DSM 21396 / JCM 16679 / CGMCC 1.7299 / I-0) TaxID=745776 RepID=H8GXR7_DEIGI|nr:hypothetical protein [Deinococcus gobiensis]AFD25919.1 hypothetical protein DGo_CA1992 [Deinococcus gobiensis I-0]